MTKAGKILVVFVTAIALSFMAFAAVVTLGGPNWVGKANDLDAFVFTENPGPPKSYSATDRVTGDSVGQSDNLAKLIKDALGRERTALQDRDQQLTDAVARAEAFLKASEEKIAADTQALQQREQEFVQQLAAVNEQIKQTHDEINQLEEQTIGLNRELGLRREDVLKLRDQLNLLRVDRDRLVVQKGKLVDVLELLDGSLQRLEQRKEQLQTQTKGYDE